MSERARPKGQIGEISFIRHPITKIQLELNGLRIERAEDHLRQSTRIASILQVPEIIRTNATAKTTILSARLFDLRARHRNLIDRVRADHAPVYRAIAEQVASPRKETPPFRKGKLESYNREIDDINRKITYRIDTVINSINAHVNQRNQALEHKKRLAERKAQLCLLREKLQNKAR